jgi:hypothetical protein
MTAPKMASTTTGGRSYKDTLPSCPVLDTLGYDHQPDVAYPSVTTVLKEGLPKKVVATIGDRPIDILDRWSARVAAEYAVDNVDEWTALLEEENGRDKAVKQIKTAPDRTRDVAAKRGEDVHDIVERLAAGQLVPTVAEDLEPWIKSARQFVAEFRPKVIWSETTVFNRQFGYAGTLDLIADFPTYGRRVVDYKTGNDIYGDVGVQLAAYRYADYGIVDDARRMLPDDIEGGLVVHLTDQGYTVVPVECGLNQLDTFVGAMVVADHCMNAAKLLGAPLRPVHLTGDDLQLVKAWLYRRVQVMVEQHPAAAATLARSWPDGVPTIGKPDHTAYDLHQIEAVVDRVEAAHEIPFGESSAPSTGPTPPPTTSKIKTKTNNRKQTAA